MLTYFENSFGIPNNNLERIIGNVTKLKIINRLDILQKKINNNGSSDKTLYIFYSGHGDSNDEGQYFITSNTNNTSKDYFTQSAYSQKELFNKLVDFDADKINMFINSCYSGEDDKGNSFVKRPVEGVFGSEKKRVSTKTKIPEKLNNKLALFTSSKYEETSFSFDYVSKEDEKQRIDLSLFTTYLIMGLQGKADGIVDNNKDDRISLYELRQYLLEKVSTKAENSYPSKKQSPTFICGRCNDDDEYLLGIN